MKLTVLLFLFISLSGFAQKKWSAISGNDIFVYSCMLVAGSADGVNQAIVHHEYGKGDQFWDFKTSWKNKYKDFDGGDESAAYVGSKDLLVGFTNGFHLTRFIDRGFTLAAVSFSTAELSQYKKKDRWKVIVKKALISTLLNRLAFNLTFNNLAGPFR